VKAVVYSAPQQFRVEQIPDPVPGRRDALVRPTLSGVCGTDLHIHDGGFFAAFPLTPGHEMTGEVVALGEDVRGLEIGQRVVIDNASPCGHCGPCGRGNPLFCENFTSLGVNAPGGFAELVRTPAAKVFDASDLAEDVAVLAEPLACAIHGMDVLDLRSGSDVLMLGSGTTGLLLAQLILHGGAGRLTVAAPTAFKLDLARRYGVDHVVQISRGDPDTTLRRLGELAPAGFDVVIDATGAVELVQGLPGLVREGGTVLVYGMCGDEQRVSWSPYDIFRRELTIKGSFAQVNCFDRSLAMLRSGRIRSEGLLTHRFGLDDFSLALQAVRSDPTCLKAVIAP